jgi:peptidoglycan/LPS O-acetylase OafA/YrhL
VSSIPQQTALKKTKARFQTIDALRGIAALAVLYFHASGGYGSITYQRGVNFGSLVDDARLLFSFGYTGVPLFFVISGFCIHLRWAKAQAQGIVPDMNFARFWKRRISRLYPAYLVALIIFVCFTGAYTLTAFHVYDFVLHLLMLHNFDPRTLFSLNPVFWTLAIEEQLYLIYFLLLPLRIRYGWRTALLVCFSARIAWAVLAIAADRFFHIEIVFGGGALANWIVWAFGALSVEAFYGLVKLPRWTRSLPVTILALLIAAVVAYVNRFASGLLLNVTNFFAIPLWGVGFFFLINFFVTREKLPTEPSVIIKGLATVGVFSYSLYLFHLLFLDIGFKFEVAHKNLFGILVLAPISLALSWVFFYLFERPFIARSQPAPVPVELSLSGNEQ